MEVRDERPTARWVCAGRCLGRCRCSERSILCPLWQVWEGAGVVKSARKLIGATNPLEAEPGTIRGDFAVQASFGCG